jgi:hypothetical protein
MRQLGLALIVLGVAGFFYCSSQVDHYEPLPEEISISKSLETPRGRFETGRYVALGGAFCGVLLAMFPQGR